MRPVFQTTEFFIMVIGKNEVNLFPGLQNSAVEFFVLPQD